MLTAHANTTPAEMMARVITLAKAFGCDGRVIDVLGECAEMVEGHDEYLDEQFTEGGEAMRGSLKDAIENTECDGLTADALLEKIVKLVDAEDAPKREDTV